MHQFDNQKRNTDDPAKTPEDLGKALKADTDEIEITNDVRSKIVRIKKTGRLLWFFAVSAISVGVFAYAASGGRKPITISGPAFELAPAVAASILGIGAALAALSIAIAGDGIEALDRLRRKYVLVERAGKTWLIKNK